MPWVHMWVEWHRSLSMLCIHRWENDTGGHHIAKSKFIHYFSRKETSPKVNTVLGFGGKKCFLPYGMCFQMDIVCAFRVLWSHPPWTTPCQCSQRTSWAPWRSRWTIFPWGQQERWVEEFAFVSWDLRRCHVLSSLALPISCSSRTPCGFQHEWACMQVQSQGTHIHMGKGEVLWHGL